MSTQDQTEGTPILFERVGAHIALVTLNRPHVRNAVNGALAQALEQAVDQIEQDETLWVAILASAGDKSFCAGADLAEVSAGRGAHLTTERGGFAGFVRAARTKPWIAAVNAVALGGGLELCLACDMIVASPTATFGLPEVKRGIFAGAGGAFRLPQAIPRALAMEMIATGAPIDAARAHALGLVNRIAADGDALSGARALAEEIAMNAPLSVRESLGLARIAQETSEADLWRRNQEVGRRIMGSADAREGPRAFLEKRAPDWKGH